MKTTLTAKQRFELSKLVQEEFTKTKMSAEAFSHFAAGKLGHPVKASQVRSITQWLGIPVNNVYRKMTPDSVINYIDKTVTEIEARLLARIDESEKLLAKLEIRLDSMKVAP
jgi:hypothetical protein